MESKGGDDNIELFGKNATVNTGSGDDVIWSASRGRKNKFNLGSGDDRIMLLGSNGTTIDGGPGDDNFQVRVFGEIGEDDDLGEELLPLRAELKGESGDDTLSWDCKSTVDVAKHSLKCKKADVWFGGMQVYRASRNRIWKDVCRGSSRPEIFCGGGRDDTMYGRGGKDRLVGGAGNDYADGGPGADRCSAERKVSC